jgi:MFS family permease
MLSSFPKRVLYISAVILVTLFSCGLRLYAAQKLDVDSDEPVYLADAVSYARDIRLGDLKMLAWSETTYEHPALYKILYGMVLLTRQPIDRLSDKDLPRRAPIASTAAAPWIAVARNLSVFWGTLAVLALTLLNPLAGLFMGIDTLSVKYTSEVYLEALPLLGSLLCALAYGKWFTQISRAPAGSPNSLLWLLLSAVFLGITAASKYVYGIVALAILLHFSIALARKQVPARLAGYMVGWVILSLLLFFVFDPYLWPHPLGRLMKSIAFHESFQESLLVQQFHYPFWQPLLWLSVFSTFHDLRPAQAFLLNIDTLIFVLALIGLPALFRKTPLFFYWLVIGLAFLLVWTTKWPQYTLIIMAPFSLSAAYGAAALWDFARRLVTTHKRQTVIS